VKLTLSLLALVGLSVWFTALATRTRQEPTDFVPPLPGPHREKLMAFKRYTQELDEDRRRREAMGAEMPEGR
jgi:hypothetical protein